MNLMNTGSILYRKVTSLKQKLIKGFDDQPNILFQPRTPKQNFVFLPSPMPVTETSCDHRTYSIQVTIMLSSEGHT